MRIRIRRVRAAIAAAITGGEGIAILLTVMFREHAFAEAVGIGPFFGHVQRGAVVIVGATGKGWGAQIEAQRQSGH